MVNPKSQIGIASIMRALPSQPALARQSKGFPVLVNLFHFLVPGHFVPISFSYGEELAHFMSHDRRTSLPHPEFTSLILLLRTVGST